MVDAWELILHHTYTGTPGVVFDHSPRRGSHGTAVNLADADFHTDGRTHGSGAVSFHPDAKVVVPAEAGWNPLSGVRGEVTCRFDTATGIDVLIDAKSFYFYRRSGELGCWFDESPHQYTDITTGLNGLGPPVSIPVGQWVRLGFLHDGVSTAELYVDDVPVARIVRPLWTVKPTTVVAIGDFVTAPPASTSGVSGRIDDVRVWRLDPDRIAREFIGRPMDPATAECWADWFDQLAAAFEALRQANPDCPKRILDLVGEAIHSGLADALTRTPQSRSTWLQAAADCQQKWTAGDLAGIATTLAGLTTWLQFEGVDLTQIPALQELLNDPCWKQLIALAPPMNCDPAFTDLLSGGAGAW
ncbi:hypothetical protein AU195_09315 [Mycobacterium sp. IS-1496]|uniref:hypothetical protein n=1 Tax=Mycobacterium sp. IS-1496 TaxID=1772284 RepID=UPI0007416116|nr:hypothetical protein [Mycobacterium sp. IS-1496]KUI34708.1 hypothetical protein AU195_09315 [Mycobacterium sp. IS-1496]